MPGFTIRRVSSSRRRSLSSAILAFSSASRAARQLLHIHGSARGLRQFW